MKVNLRVSWESVPLDKFAKSDNSTVGSKWIPEPRMGGSASWIRTEEMNMPNAPVRETRPEVADPECRIVSLVGSANSEEQNPSSASLDGIRFGFAGPVDCVMSLTIPAEGVNGQKHPSALFELEFNPEQPDRITVSLMDLDEDKFIHTVQKSISFPARLLAELLSRRKATAEEIAEWQIPPEDE